MFLLIVLFSMSSIVYANNALKLEIKGVNESKNCIMLQGKILVNSEALSHLTNIKWQFVKKSEPIIFTRTDTKDKLKIQM